MTRKNPVQSTADIPCKDCHLMVAHGHRKHQRKNRGRLTAASETAKRRNQIILIQSNKKQKGFLGSGNQSELWIQYYGTCFLIFLV